MDLFAFAKRLFALLLAVVINLVAIPFARMTMFGMIEGTVVTSGMIVAGIIAFVLANIPLLLLIAVFRESHRWQLIGWLLAISYTASLLTFSINLIDEKLPLTLITISSITLFIWSIQWARRKKV